MTMTLFIKDCQTCKDNIYQDHWTRHIWQAFNKAKANGQRSAYAEYSDTIRQVPENYCLAVNGYEGWQASCDKACTISEDKINKIIAKWDGENPHDLALEISKHV